MNQEDIIVFRKKQTTGKSVYRLQHTEQREADFRGIQIKQVWVVYWVWGKYQL